MQGKGFIILLILLLTSLLLSFNYSSTHSDKQSEFHTELYDHFIEGKIENWIIIVDRMERYYSSYSVPAMLYDLLLARYGLIALSLNKDEKETAREHLDKAEDELTDLFNYRAYVSRAYALQGSFYAFRITLNPLNAVTLGSRANTAIDNALEADPGNPTAWMEMGNSKFYTPKAIGGSKKMAVKYYNKAVEKFENDMHTNQRWLYLNTLMNLAKSYQYIEQHALAINTYEKILKFEPGFKLVSEELLPEAKKR